MTTTRFIARYRGTGAAPTDDVARIRNIDDVVVVEATPRMLLVEARPESLQNLVDTLPKWAVWPEQHYALPDDRPKVEGPPE